MKNSTPGSGLLAVFAVLLLAGIGCTNYEIPGKGSVEPQKNFCEDCHTDLERLMAVQTPDSAASFDGFYMDVPYYEPYERVYLGGVGYDAFKESPHYSVGCTGCHNGDSNVDDKDQAHSGDWTASPSMFYQDKCASCHATITDDFVTSLHNGTGQKRKVAMRAGLAGPEEFDQLPAHQTEAFTQKCATCHGTCGNCHVVRPAVAGGGLSDGHNFIGTPSMENTCVKCHSLGGGNAYLGTIPGSSPDVHSSGSGYSCLDCHDGPELHGDGQPVEHRYAYSELPDCEDCHTGIETANVFHNMHFGDFQCQICHSQDYTNCGACHIKDGQVEFEPYSDYKIGLNPLADLKDYKLALLRRSPAHPDNWVGYGQDLDYGNFDVFPTYNYTTPHNILRWTERTQGTACSSNCHIRNEGGNLINVENFLWLDSLETWEVDATGPFTVDGQLPAYWFN